MAEPRRIIKNGRVVVFSNAAQASENEVTEEVIVSKPT